MREIKICGGHIPAKLRLQCLLVISGVFSRHGGGDLRLGPQIEDLLADRRVADIITTVAAPADCVCRPAKAIFFAMVVDDAQPALVDKLIKTGRAGRGGPGVGIERSEEHTSELQSLMRISYAVF